jgi:hypothetical protein
VGDYAYVADTEGLHVLEISNPANPTLAGSYETREHVNGVHVAGDYAYIAATGGLRVLDVSDHSKPTLASSYDTPGPAMDVHVEGDYAYVAVEETGLLVFDISDFS